MQSVDQRYDLRAGQEVSVQFRTVRQTLLEERLYRREDNILKGFLVQFKKYLQCGTYTGRLNLAPETTLVTAYTVHDTSDVAEVSLEFLLQDLEMSMNHT